MDVLGLTDISISGSGGQLRWETCYTTGAPTRGISAHDNATYATVQGPSGRATVKGNWNHFCITVDPSGSGRAIEYWDGVKIGDYAANGGHLNGNFWTGETNKVNGEIQDIRIYDHALSPLEVKEISKGLILHYPLNRNGWGQENLVWNSNWNVHSTTPPESWVNWGSPPTKEIVTIDGKNWLHVISNTGRFQGYSQNWTKRNGVGELTANTKITVSFTAKLATAASIAPIGIHWCNSSGTIITQNWTTTALTTSPERYSFTYTTPADCVAFNIMVGDDTNTAHEVWITDIKLEFGEIATPWCPNSSDTLATIMGLNDIVEYDTSGYCNNGTRKGTSRFSWTSDTPKYNVSQIFSGIHRIEAPFNPGNSPTFTVAGWFYHTGGTTYYGAKNSYNTFICLEGGRYFVYNSTGSAYVGYWTSTANTWQHVVLVHDAVTTKLKLYINGNFVSEVTTNGTIYGSDILDIGGRQGAAQYRGKMSDFRIYATALSADDVKSLYNNSAYIDNQGNIYGAIYEEV